MSMQVGKGEEGGGAIKRKAEEKRKKEVEDICMCVCVFVCTLGRRGEKGRGVGGSWSQLCVFTQRWGGGQFNSALRSNATLNPK